MEDFMDHQKLSPWERGHLASFENELCYPSPNKKITVYLRYEGEIRFGPCYFSILINSKRVPQRIFGGEIFWSDDSRYFATEEWLNTEYSKGPHTRLVLFDMETQREAVVAESISGFVSLLRFYPESVTYQERRGNDRRLRNAAFDEILGWQYISCAAA